MFVLRLVRMGTGCSMNRMIILLLLWHHWIWCLRLDRDRLEYGRLGCFV